MSENEMRREWEQHNLSTITRCVLLLTAFICSAAMPAVWGTTLESIMGLGHCVALSPDALEESSGRQAVRVMVLSQQ